MHEDFIDALKYLHAIEDILSGNPEYMQQMYI